MRAEIISTALAATLLAAPATAADDGRWTTPTMVGARAAMLEPALNFLTFQHMDQLFATRTVAAGDTPSPLAEAPADIGDAFSFAGEPVDLEGFLEATSTNALLVLRHGAIAAEIYRNGSDRRTRFMSFSMAKSILSVMIGIAAGEGKIRSIDDRVVDYLPDWKGTAYADVTIRDLLRMRSGVDWLEVYEFGSDTQLTKVHDNSLVAYRYRWCDYARNEAKRAGPAGATFNYSTLDTSVLGCVLEAAIGGKGADYLSEKVWKPAGMEADGLYLLDGPDSVGREFYGAGFDARLRDYGRFGLMMLHDGEADGRRIVPADWVRASTVPEAGEEPASKDDVFGYRYQWWTIPNSDAYTAIGLYNQFIYVDPTTDTVIVKLDAPASPLGFEEENVTFFQTIAANLGK